MRAGVRSSGGKWTKGDEKKGGGHGEGVKGCQPHAAMKWADRQLTSFFEMLPGFHLVMDEDAEPGSEGKADRHMGRAGRGSSC